MELRTNPEYSERLASFFTSLGQRAVVVGPGRVDVSLPADEAVAERELAIYLRVWAVMYPDAQVTVDRTP
jgi:hypothetical protein